MSENIHQVFIANPITTNADTDLMYFGQSPYGAGNDAAMLFANFKGQFVFVAGSGTDSAKGSGSSVSGNNALGLGASADAIGDNSIAVGASARTLDGNSIAVGNGAHADGDSSIAVGNGAVCDSSDSIAVGAGATANGESTTALGNGAHAVGDGSVAIGDTAIANGSGSLIGIGYQVTNTSQNGSVIGASCGAAGTQNLVMGYTTTIGSGSNNIAIGAFSSVGNGSYSIVIGEGTTSPTGSDHSIVIGHQAASNSTYGIAIGEMATINNTNSIAIGQSSTSSANNSIAIGYSTGTNGTGSIALGYQAATVNAGSFVSCDSNGIPFEDTGSNQWSHTFAGGFNFALNSTTLSSQIDTNGNFINKNSVADQSYSLQTPSTGFTITIANNIKTLILNPSGTLAAGTINLPSTPIDGQEVRVCTSQIITSLTVNAQGGQTIINAPTTLALGTGFYYQYNASGTTWYRHY